MKPETIEFLQSLFDHYAESSSGKESENRAALEAAAADVNSLVGRTIVPEISGGVLVNVHGLPHGWTYDVADWDEKGDYFEEANRKLIEDANAQNI